MTDQEFDIIDELYFVTPYKDLKEATGFSDGQLQESLIQLTEKGWVRVYKSVDEESEMKTINLNSDFQTFFYLASKKGLFEHNAQ